MGKSRPLSISISPNQIREFGSSSPCETKLRNNVSYRTVKAAHNGNPGKLAAADITTLI